MNLKTTRSLMLAAPALLAGTMLTVGCDDMGEPPAAPPADDGMDPAPMEPEQPQQPAEDDFDTDPDPAGGDDDFGLPE